MPKQQVDQAREFLRDLSELPFLALVVDEDNVLKVYTKDLDPEEVRTIKETLLGSDEED